MENIQDLLQSYKEERKRWIAIRELLKCRIEELKNEILCARKELDENILEARYSEIEFLYLEDKLKEMIKEDRLIAGMISDMTFAIDWLNKGGHPHNRRGIERRSVYQRTTFIDPYVLQNMFKGYESRSASTVTGEEKWLIESALQKLSKNERDIFIMHFARCISANEIANMLGVSKSTVETHIKRCKEKMKRDTHLLLF